MNLIFWRNVLSVIFLVAFAGDLVFGNGVENWWDWLYGAVFVGAVDDLVSTLEKHQGKRTRYKFDGDFISNVLSVLVVAMFVVCLVSGNIFWNWRDWIVGAGFAYSFRNLAVTFRDRARR